MARLAGWREEPRAFPSPASAKARDEFGADLVGFLRDARAERGAMSAALCADPLHGRDGRLDDAGQRAFPAGMRRADDARLCVGEQDHAAVGAGDAERQARRRGHHCVAARPRVGRPVIGDRDRVGRMDLEGHREALGTNAERGGHPGAVLGDGLGASREPTPPLREA